MADPVPFLWTTLHVADLDRAVRFYEQVVGLKVSSRIEAPGASIAFLGGGATKLELVADPQIRTPDLGRNSAIGFGVADLEAALAHVARLGVAVTAGPVQAGPRTRFFFVRDPDGMTVQFVEEK